ncbi:NAD-dependent epimerase/dehydratase family protein [Stenotrophomonas nitritireducens]|uniref:NAD-dependent epimerase/dehydratase domain-containing protein n=1 Tax=Stenotrophomonas nitritireducens TaxID=83617 RepID=A0ABR5NGG9_9GAMM|nr:NAD-dependent epimerase/dehydratase family protein [Stenotrophomonas nitritireducens]KRG54783.1 hypothetical protein ABB22_15610 [Stenotrophomonas nitritireducens]
MTKPVLLIGAGGFVGRQLLEAMTRQGEDVIAVSRRPLVAPSNQVEVHVRELREPADFAVFLDRVRAVVHVASTTTPASSAGRPMLELEGNLRPILGLLEAMHSYSHLSLVYMSSGGALCSRLYDAPQNESSAFHSRSYHGAGKLAAEQFIESWCHQSSGNAIVFRPSNLYGPGQDERPGFGIIPAAFGKLVRGEVLQVWGDGSTKRDYLYIDDFNSLVLSALRTPNISGFNVFNACSGTSIDLNSLFSAIEQVTGRTLHRQHGAARVVDIPSVHLQSTSSLCRFGWRPQFDLADGLEHTWQWFTTSKH